MRVIARGPETHPRLTYWEIAEGKRFENPTVPETIGPDLTSSFQSQSLTEESEADKTAIKTDGTL